MRSKFLDFLKHLSWLSISLILFNIMSGLFAFQKEREGHINPKIIKQNLSSWSSHQFEGNTVIQGLFTSNLDNEDYILSTSSVLPSHVPLHQEEKLHPLKKSHWKHEKMILQPMKQKERLQIFSCEPIPSTSQDVEEISIGNKKEDHKSNESENEAIKKSEKFIHIPHRRPHKKFDDQQTQVNKQQAQKQEKHKKIGHHHHQKVDLCDASAQFVYEQEPISPKRQVSEHNLKEDVHSLKFFFPKKNSAPESIHKEEHLPSQQRLSSVKGSQFFSMLDEQQLKLQLYQEVPPMTTLRMEVIRDKSGFNTFWPQFHLRFTTDKIRMLSAKMSSHHSSTFIMSKSDTIFEEGSLQFMGKIKEASHGNALNIFSPGFNPTDAKAHGVPPRQLLATIVYTDRFDQDGPRRFKLYVLQQEYSYYKDFPQVHMYGEEITLDQLYWHPENKKKIRVLQNRKPIWHQKIGCYLLNFRGLAPCLSVKNFILQDESNGQEVILFGKQFDDTYNLDISSGISPYIAFGVAIANFDS